MNELRGACIVGQSGGPTAVINASAYGVIRTALAPLATTASASAAASAWPNGRLHTHPSGCAPGARRAAAAAGNSAPQAQAGRGARQLVDNDRLFRVISRVQLSQLFW